MFRKLLTYYKDLPPELRTLVALMGVGTPIGAIYLLQRLVQGVTGTQIPTIVLMLIIAFGIAALSLIGWLISKLFGRGAKKRSKKLAADLERDSDRANVSMDVRAAIKGNNEKFFSAIKDMKKNLGISVYDLPWYIIIGDSGCGKTKLINEGGLTFSTGKPEGYQLGTLNYNWWFTEDAVFVDMAGRLCNPKDDGDYREWQAFLDTVSKGRRGYPINGALACVSVEHLLQDSPEKVEADANTMLERLRDLQSRLGVTFATYLVVTKCDKVLGFMQFFDRAERDITVKNQIFGWSKPGEFNLLLDPEHFKDEFGSLYRRLNDLRLRRLSDDGETPELGAAYCFPEEFRELQPPLETYVRTLFPMIKNPRAIKNLIFRGVYFTSATQQGSVILKHLVERLGADAAQHFQPLESLYPRPRPHFVKDVLFRKVFPEFGLVFRNEEQALRNQRLARIFRVASVTLALLVTTTLTWGVMTFRGLMGTPRDLVGPQAGTNGEVLPARAALASGISPTASLEISQKLGECRDRLIESPWSRRVLSLGIGSGQPIEDIQTIRAGEFQEGVLRPGLELVEDKLRSMQLGFYGTPDSAEGAQAFAECLTEYLYISGFLARKDARPEVTEEKLKRLFAIAKTRAEPYGEMILDLSWQQFEKELAAYIEVANKHPEQFNPAAVLGNAKLDPLGTATVAMATYRSYLSSLTRMEADHPDPVVGQWMRLRSACETALARYDSILGLSDQGKALPRNTSELATFRGDFERLHGEFQKAVEGCRWQQTAANDPLKKLPVESLHDALARQRKIWVTNHDTWYWAYSGVKPAAAAELSIPGRAGEAAKEALGGAPAIPLPGELDVRIIAVIDGLLKKPEDAPRVEDGLDETLRRNLHAAGLLKVDAEETGSPLDGLQEVYKTYGYMLAVQRRDGDPADVIRGVSWSPALGVAAKVLQQAADQLKQLSSVREGAATAEDQPAAFSERLIAAIRAVEATAEAKAPQIAMEPSDQAAWKADQLGAFVRDLNVLVARGALADELTQAAESLARADRAGGWGLAALYTADFQQPTPSFFSIAAEKQPVREPDGKSAKRRLPSKDSKTLDDFRRTGGGRWKQDAGRRKRARSPDEHAATKTIPRCAEQQFLYSAFNDAAMLGNVLRAVRPEDYLADEDVDLARDCQDVVDRVKGQYLERYFQEWRQAYDKSAFDGLDDTLAKGNWRDFKGRLEKQYIDVGEDLRQGLLELLQNVAWADFDWFSEEGAADDWRQDRTLLGEARSAAWQGLKFVDKIRELTLRGEAPPWEEISDRASEDWRKFARQVSEYPELPADFTLPDQTPLAAIAWRVFSEDVAFRLEDVKFIQKAMEISKKASQLLDVEIQNRLVGLQEMFHYEGPSVPYLDVKDLKVVEPARFGNFLGQVAVAERLFREVDRGLSGYESDRKPFYQVCGEWRDLIAPKGERSYSVPLKVTVQMDHQYGSGQHLGVKWWNGTPPAGGAQNFYSEVQLCLGLSIGEVIDECAVRFPTTPDPDRPNRLESTWTWPATGAAGKAATVKLTGRGSDLYGGNWPEITIGQLGEISPLLLPSFLQQMGTPDNSRRVWRSGTRWDLAKVFGDNNLSQDVRRLQTLDNAKPEDKVVGTKFVFELDRPLPQPITCLKKK